jgi:hypothetical protein
MKQVTKEEVMKQMDESVHLAIEASIVKNKATHLVLFENQDFCSSKFGARTAVCVGPECTYKKPEECNNHWLNDLPSQRQYATTFCEC